MKEVEYVTFNNIDYIIVDSVKYNHYKYIYMVNENDPKDFYIRKLVNEDGKTYYTNVDNEKDLDLLINFFNNKINGKKDC